MPGPTKRKMPMKEQHIGTAGRSMPAKHQVPKEHVDQMPPWSRQSAGLKVARAKGQLAKGSEMWEQRQRRAGLFGKKSKPQTRKARSR